MRCSSQPSQYRAALQHLALHSTAYCTPHTTYCKPGYMAWYDTAHPGMAQDDPVQHSLAWPGSAQPGMVQSSTAWHGPDQHIATRFGTVRRGIACTRARVRARTHTCTHARACNRAYAHAPRLPCALHCVELCTCIVLSSVVCVVCVRVCMRARTCYVCVFKYACLCAHAPAQSCACACVRACARTYMTSITRICHWQVAYKIEDGIPNLIPADATRLVD